MFILLTIVTLVAAFFISKTVHYLLCSDSVCQHKVSRKIRDVIKKQKNQRKEVDDLSKRVEVLALDIEK